MQSPLSYQQPRGAPRELGKDFCHGCGGTGQGGMALSEEAWDRKHRDPSLMYSQGHPDKTTALTARMGARHGELEARQPVQEALGALGALPSAARDLNVSWDTAEVSTSTAHQDVGHSWVQGLDSLVSDSFSKLFDSVMVLLHQQHTNLE